MSNRFTVCDTDKLWEMRAMCRRMRKAGQGCDEIREDLSLMFKFVMTLENRLIEAMNPGEEMNFVEYEDLPVPEGGWRYR